MTAAAFKLKQEPPTDDRAGLRLAIAAFEAAQQAVAEHNQAIARADQLVDQRREALDAARAAVVQAADADAESAARAIRNSAPPPAGKTRQARADEVLAEDDLNAAEAALRTLDKQRQRLADAQGAARQEVHRRVNSTLAGFLSALCDRVEDAQREILVCSHALDVLSVESPGVFTDDAWPPELISVYSGARALSRDTAPTIEGLLALRPVREKFTEARQRLHSDADTRLPDL